jgi:hypothetical protein
MPRNFFRHGMLNAKLLRTRAYINLLRVPQWVTGSLGTLFIGGLLFVSLDAAGLPLKVIKPVPVTFASTKDLNDIKSTLDHIEQKAIVVDSRTNQVAGGVDSPALEEAFAKNANFNGNNYIQRLQTLESLYASMDARLRVLEKNPVHEHSGWRSR